MRVGSAFVCGDVSKLSHQQLRDVTVGYVRIHTAVLLMNDKQYRVLRMRASLPSMCTPTHAYNRAKKLTLVAYFEPIHRAVDLHVRNTAILKPAISH